METKLNREELLLEILKYSDDKDFMEKINNITFVFSDKYLSFGNRNKRKLNKDQLEAIKNF